MADSSSTISTTTSASGYISLTGFNTSIDIGSIITAIDAANRAQETTLSNQITSLQDQNSAYSSIVTSLQNLSDTISDLSTSDVFKSHAAKSSTATVATATADTTAVNGSYSINITQLATSSVLTSGIKASGIPSSSDNVISSLGATAGTFSINGTKVTIDSSTTIDSLLSSMNSISGITASYDNSTGKFTIASSSGSLVLGTSSDTSNFLKAAQLYNNNVSSGSVTSSLGVGRLDTTQTLSSINFGGGSVTSNGTLVINGVSISYSATDTLSEVISKINDSDAGVTASYDSYADQFVLTSNTRGALDISVGSSELADALGITSGTGSVAVGNDTLYTINGGSVRTATGSTISAEDSGLTGITITPLSTGTTTITVSPDTDAVAKKINAFIDQYNSTQNMIESYVKIDTTDSSTSSTTSSNNGVLSSDGTLTFLASDLRSSINAVFNSSGTYRMLEDLGIKGNDSDNTLTQVDTTALEDALTNHLSEVVNMFTYQSSDTTTDKGGLYQRLNATITSYEDSSTGVIAMRKQSNADQIDSLNDEILRIDTQADSEKAHLEESFAALEAYSAQASQYTSYLDQLKSNSSS